MHVNRDRQNIRLYGVLPFLVSTFSLHACHGRVYNYHNWTLLYYSHLDTFETDL